MQIQFLFHKQCLTRVLSLDYCLGFPKVLNLNRIILSEWPDDKKKISKEFFLVNGQMIKRKSQKSFFFKKNSYVLDYWILNLKSSYCNPVEEV
jgi:hypothetical protein